jgi:hypothetical protein
MHLVRRLLLLSVPAASFHPAARLRALLALLLAAGLTPGGAAEPSAGEPLDRVVRLTGFTWDRVPLNPHFGKRTGDLTEEEVAFVAQRSSLIVLKLATNQARIDWR